MEHLSFTQAVFLGVCVGLGWALGKYACDGIWFLGGLLLERYRARQARKAWAAIMAEDTPFARCLTQVADSFAIMFGQKRREPEQQPTDSTKAN